MLYCDDYHRPVLHDLILATDVELKSARLVLEPRCAAHAAAMFTGLQNEAVFQWISMKRPASVESLRADFLRLESRLSPDRSEAWLAWVAIEPVQDTVIGQIDVCIDPKRCCTNFGYYFFPPFWGRGYASEATTVVVQHLQALGIGPMVATVTAGNISSERVLEKAGFVRTRLLPGNDTLRGELVDDWEFVRA